MILNHSSSQALNQQRLETYLSSYGQPNLDLTDRLQDDATDFQQQRISAASGADTPKDLTARVRIIELFTLHVLPRNEEWEYAREFINFSEVLDEERKELFIQTLDGLKEEKERGDLRAAELQRQKDLEFERQREEERRRAEEEADAARPQPNGHKRNPSEVDYGSGKGSPRTPRSKGSRSDKPSSSKTSSRTALSSGSKSSKKQVKPEPRPSQSRAVANMLRSLFKQIIQSVSGNPLSIVRTLLFVLGILMAISRQDVRDRVRRITGSAWEKVKGTAGMGMKVSYI